MSASGLPRGWEVRHSKTKNLPYYFNPETEESLWEPPADTDTNKLKAFMAENHTLNGQNGVKVAEGDVDGKIRAAHLLVKHRESRRPSSWREQNITRTKAEAMEIIKAHQANIESGRVTLGDLAMQESDCSSARKCGDLGFFGRGEMQKEFETAAFKLEPGKMSGVVDTASGLHLIQRLQ